MKVGIVTEYYYPVLGGITENVHHTAVHLKKRGHEPTIITSHVPANGTGGDDTAPDSIPVIRVGRSMRIYGNGSFARVTVGAHLWRDLSAAIRREQFDLLHVHAPLMFTLPPMALLADNCAKVGTFHSHFGDSLIYRTFRDLLQRQFLDRLDGHIMVSQSCLDALEPYFKLRPRIIANGVDTDLFNPKVAPLEQFDRSKRTLLFLGRLDPRNGLGFTLRVFEMVKREFPDVRLVVVGDGPLRPYYSSAVPASIRSDVHFEGAVLHDRPRYYASADVYFAPTTKASFGITLLEAMASATPIVAFDNVGYRALLGREEGVLVPPEDVRRSAEAIVGLLRDDARREEMGQRGREKAVRFSWDIIVSELLAYYEEILQR